MIIQISGSPFVWVLTFNKLLPYHIRSVHHHHRCRFVIPQAQICRYYKCEDVVVGNVAIDRRRKFDVKYFPSKRYSILKSQGKLINFLLPVLRLIVPVPVLGHIRTPPLLWYVVW